MRADCNQDRVEVPPQGHEPPWREERGFPGRPPPMYPQRRWGAGGDDDAPPRSQGSGSADPVVVMQLQRQLSEQRREERRIDLPERTPQPDVEEVAEISVADVIIIRRIS